ncbi:MAG: rhomboid family intramembrane serine protease [Nanoarchaeota archaeon]|nr:rhomboid family intramembrane serine protease [Nanoarchaeota archaeon]
MNSYTYGIGNKKSFGTRLKELSIVIWLIIVTTIISITGFILTKVYPDSINYFALMPSNIIQGKYLWTLVTHIFIHAGAFHLLINMFVLFSLGSLCEKIIGRKRFFWFYLISGVFAGILSVALSGLFGNTSLGARIFGQPDIYMVGASGAIFAIAGLYVLLLPHLRFMIIFLPFFSLPAYIMIPLALFGVWIISILAGWPIGNVAHFGGFIAGLVYGLYLRTKYKKKVNLLQKMFR